MSDPLSVQTEIDLFAHVAKAIACLRMAQEEAEQLCHESRYDIAAALEKARDARKWMANGDT